mgnify:CR=1 FL=1
MTPTATAQNQYALAGRLENESVIASIALKMVGDSDHGLKHLCLEEAETTLCDRITALLNTYSETDREDWAELKIECLKQHGSPIASCIDHLASAARTPAISESALRSAGYAHYEASERKARHTSQAWFRNLIVTA